MVFQHCRGLILRRAGWQAGRLAMIFMSVLGLESHQTRPGTKFQSQKFPSFNV
jgi:hypothetical protein